MSDDRFSAYFAVSDVDVRKCADALRNSWFTFQHPFLTFAPIHTSMAQVLGLKTPQDNEPVGPTHLGSCSSEVL